MVVTYCTADEVAEFLQVDGSAYSVSTSPTTAEVEKFINRVEDHIDTQTQHAWRVRASGTRAFADSTQIYEHYDVENFRERNTGVPVFLNHRKIKTLSAGDGDELELWNGNTWEDFIANRTSGRNKDYWIDYDKGIIYLLTVPMLGPQMLRIKYRYGEATVPKDLNDAAIGLTAIKILQSNDQSPQQADGADGIPIAQRIAMIKREALASLYPFIEVKA